jgi:hypothetical protein
MAEQQRCGTELCVRFGKSGSETPQFIHHTNGDDVMRRATVFKWWKCFRRNFEVVKKSNRLFHYPPEACGKQSATRFREVGGAL